jgi:hypothetical protein
MLESRSYYHPHGETGSKPYKWCVKFLVEQKISFGDQTYVNSVDRGIIGFSREWEAKRWLDNALEMHKNGAYFSQNPIIETGVYNAGVRH